MKNDDVVITGMGLLSSLGNDVEGIWHKLLNLENGVKTIDQNNALYGYGIHVLSPCSPFDLEALLPNRKLRKSMNRVSKMMVYTGLKALHQAGFSCREEVEALNVGAIVGTGTSLCDEYQGLDYTKRNPKWFLDTYPNVHLAYLSIAAGLTGHGSTIVNACTSASQAIGSAFHMIRNGGFDILLAGGADSRISPSFLSGFSRLNMHTNAKCADSAMRPFDKDRSGFVLGEGAGMLTIERYSHALKRGATPLARIVGYGSSMDAMRITDPSEKGKLNAMLSALKDADLAAKEIGYINSHGTSTFLNDKTESKAIRLCFPDTHHKIPVNSTKSMLGHTLAASGGIESAICIKTLQEQTIHPTRNFQAGDRDCQLNIVTGQPLKQHVGYCLNNSSGIGGFNTSLIFAAA